MSKPAFSMLQTALRDLGFSTGAIDGVFGPKSQAAYRALEAAGFVPAGDLVATVTAGKIFQGAARYLVAEVVVHCSATRPSWMEGQSLSAQREEIRRWHVKDRGWRDIGYHWIIGRDGKILPGRPETEIGAGVEGHNAGVIHVCLIGGQGSTERDQFSRNFTAQQDVTLRQLLQGIGMRTQIRKITGHNQYAAKACPGFTVSEWLKEAS